MLRKIKRKYNKENTRGATLLMDSFFDVSYKKHEVESYPESDDGPILTPSGMVFNGIDSILEIDNSDDFYLSDEDFTIQYWVKRTDEIDRIHRICGQAGTGLTTANISFVSWINAGPNNRSAGKLSTGTVEYVFTNTYVPLSELNAWYHIAIVRSGDNVYEYVNGTRGDAVDVTGAVFQNVANQFIIGRCGDHDFNYLNGIIQDFQIIKGTALYTGATENIPTRGKMQLHPDTVLALPLSNKTSDVNLAQTIVGYGEQFKGGKIAVSDGTTDGFLIPNSSTFNFGANDFTIDIIFLNDSVGVSEVLLDFWQTVGDRAWLIEKRADDTFNFAFSNDGTAFTNLISNTAITDNTRYNHVAVVGRSGNINIYLNGKLDTTPETQGTLHARSADFSIGMYNDGAYSLNGKYKSVRMINGEALWDENFTPPKELLKVSDNVVFLENFNELNSCSFNGTSQWIDTLDHTDFTLGSKDFTIQYWFKTNGAFTQAKRTAGQIDASATLTEISFFTGFGYSGGNNLIYGVVYSGSTPYPVSQIDNTKDDSKWHHYAFVREGDILRIFIDGSYVQDNQSMPASTVINDSSANLAIGRMGEYVANSFDGNIKNFKIDVDVCLYPGETTFTPPLVFNDYIITDNTAVFVPMENNILTDCSPSNHTFTNNGTVILEADGYDKSGNLHTIENIGDIYTEYFHPGDIRFDGSNDFLEIGQSTNNVMNFDIANDEYIEMSHKVGVFAIASTDYLQLEDSDDWFFDDEDYTISMLIKRSSTGTLTRIIGQSNVAGDPISSSWYLQITAGNQLTTGFNDSTNTGHTANNGSLTSTSAWYHIAYVRDGDTIRTYIDGVHQTNTIDVTGLSNNDSSAPLGIGRVGDYGGSTAEYFDGSMKNVLVVKGKCLYPNGTTFTPPSDYKDYQIDDADVKLFIDFNNQAVDRSLSGHEIKNMGVSFIQDNTNPINNIDLGTNSFTIDGWLYTPALSGLYTFAIAQGGSGDNSFSVFKRSSGGNHVLRLSTYSTGDALIANIDSNSSIVADEWFHFAYTRDINSVYKMYLNGVLQTDTASVATAIASSQHSIVVGGGFYSDDTIDATHCWNGGMKNIRMFIGDVLWDSAFIPPKTEKDYAKQFNDNCTFWLKGDAQIDSSRANKYVDDAQTVLLIRGDEWVSGSTFTESSDSAHTITLNGDVAEISNDYWSFGGTGDYLSILNNQNFNFGTNPFTIEAYTYFNNTTSTENICQQGYYTIGVNGNWSLFRYNSVLRFVTYDGQGNVEWLETVGTISATTWHHISISRVGTGADGIQIAIDGTAETFTVSKHVGGNDSAITFGLQDGGGNADFDGRMGDIMVINGRGIRNGNFTPPARGAATLNYSVDYVQDTTNPILNTLDLSDKDFTIEALVKFDNAAGVDGESIISKWQVSGGDNRSFRLSRRSSTNSGTVRISVNTPSGSISAVGTSTLTANTLYHIAGVRYNNMLYLYVNGIQEHSISITGAMYSNSNLPIYIGAMVDSAGTGKDQLLDGSIIKPRIYIGEAKYKHNFIPA